MLLLNPVVGSGETHFSIRRVNVIGDAPDGFGDDGEVALAVDEKCWDADALLFGEPSALESAAQERAEVRAVVVDGGGQRAALAHRGFEHRDVFVSERAGPRRASEHLFESGEVVAPYPPFGYRGQLEEEHVPASQKLAQR